MSQLVVNSPESSRYEIVVDGQTVGFAAYELRRDAIVFTHTEVDASRQERGLGGALVRAALDDVRASTTLRVVDRCPFVKQWIGTHPEYRDLLAR